MHGVSGSRLWVGMELGLTGMMLWSTSLLLRGVEGGSQAERGRHRTAGERPCWAGNREGNPLTGGGLGTGLKSQLEIPGKRHRSSGSSGISPAPAFLVGVGPNVSALAPHPPSRLPQQTCAVCLEDFKVKEELGVLPCQHAFHRK